MPYWAHHTQITGWSKTGTGLIFAIIAVNIHRFHCSFTGWLVSKFAIKSILNTPPHLINVATLWNINVTKIAIIWNNVVINDKSQGSVATQGVVVMYYYILFYVCRWKNFYNRQIFGEVTSNWLIASHALFPFFHALSCLKVKISPDKLRITNRSCC